MCGYNLCCKQNCVKPAYGGIYSNSEYTYEYEEGEVQTVVLDVPMYSKNVAAAVGTLTPETGGYYLVTMSADVMQTEGNPGDFELQLTIDGAAEGYFTQKIDNGIEVLDRLSKSGIVHIPAGAEVSLKVVSTGDPSRLKMDDAHLCIIKIDDEEQPCNCCQR
jgi:hypothetical protein